MIAFVKALKVLFTNPCLGEINIDMFRFIIKIHVGTVLCNCKGKYPCLNLVYN